MKQKTKIRKGLNEYWYPQRVEKQEQWDTNTEINTNTEIKALRDEMNRDTQTNTKEFWNVHEH